LAAVAPDQRQAKNRIVAVRNNRLSQCFRLSPLNVKNAFSAKTGCPPGERAGGFVRALAVAPPALPPKRAKLFSG
jgi:hypothetical protein